MSDEAVEEPGAGEAGGGGLDEGGTISVVVGVGAEEAALTPATAISSNRTDKFRTQGPFTNSSTGIVRQSVLSQKTFKSTAIIESEKRREKRKAMKDRELIRSDKLSRSQENIPKPSVLICQAISARNKRK